MDNHTAKNLLETQLDFMDGFVSPSVNQDTKLVDIELGVTLGEVRKETTE